MNIGLLGYGTVGGGVDRILREDPALKVTRVLSLFSTEEMASRYTDRAEDILKDPAIDTVVEVLGGIHPAYEWISEAIRAGKNVVTANKAVVAACYRELVSLSREMNVSFRCTAAAGGGIPWLTCLERVKKNDRVEAVFGVMNGSCNYILSEMEKGGSFDAALKNAQALGFAERDPSADVDGPDTLRKLMISSCIAFNGYIAEDEIPCRGIRTVRTEDLAFLKEKGLKLKLFAYAAEKDGKIVSAVKPAAFPEGSALAGIHQNLNLIGCRLKYGGTLTLTGEGAGRFPTAANVVRDLRDVAAFRPAFYAEGLQPLHVDNTALKRIYYVRTSAEDPFLEKIAAEKDGAYIKTLPVPVPDMHAFLSSLEADGTPVFAAAVPEEEAYA